MLSDKRIKEEMQRGNVVIRPFRDDFLGTNSYDCTLGKSYYEANEEMLEMYVDDPSHVTSFWKGPMEAQWDNSKQASYIPVFPGRTILAHTQEIIGGRNGFLAKMHSKSTTARYGLSVCKCAGVGDVEYISTWTMEISNHTQTIIKLPTGMKICQFVFEDVGCTLKKYQGHYGQNPDFKPQDMLPKATKVPKHFIHVSKADDILPLREMEVLKYMSYGVEDTEIAQKLSLSISTVLSYIAHIKQRLNLHSRVELTIYALKTGLINLEDINLDERRTRRGGS
jgi:dCTP deaminase